MREVSELARALRRLEQSSTRITRKNARAEALSVLCAIRKNIDAGFPPINKDGTSRRAAKKPCCPLCGIPCESWTVLVHHLARKHQFGTSAGWSCACGKRLVRTKSAAAHLRGVAANGDLKLHMAKGLVAR